MKDDEPFIELYTELSNIFNSCFNLGEMIPKSREVRKILGYLLEIFRSKVTNIEESKNMDLVRVEKVVGSLQTYEMTLPSVRRPIEAALKASSRDKEKSRDESKQVLTQFKISMFMIKFKTFMKLKKKTNLKHESK